MVIRLMNFKLGSQSLFGVLQLPPHTPLPSLTVIKRALVRAIVTRLTYGQNFPVFARLL